MEQRRAHCSAALTRPFRTVLIDLQCSTRCLVCSSPRRCWPPLDAAAGCIPSARACLADSAVVLHSGLPLALPTLLQSVLPP